jgi:hypothetical protein
LKPFNRTENKHWILCDPCGPCKNECDYFGDCDKLDVWGYWVHEKWPPDGKSLRFDGYRKYRVKNRYIEGIVI